MKSILILLTAAVLCCTMIVLCTYRNTTTEPNTTELEYMFYSGANASGDMDSCYREAVKMLPKEDLKPIERKGWWYGRGRRGYN